MRGEQRWEAARAARGPERQLARRVAALVRRERQAVWAVARALLLKRRFHDVFSCEIDV